MKAGLPHLLLLLVVIFISLISFLFIFQGEAGHGFIDRIGSSSIDLQNNEVGETQKFGMSISLPFNPAEISFNSGIANPFGLIRQNSDREHGHGGIDIPLHTGGEIRAVTDGEIVGIERSPGGDADKLVLLLQKLSEGEGWVFVYKKISVKDGLFVGQKVKSGELLGINKSSVNHFQLSYSFNDFEVFSDALCWVDYLNASDKQNLEQYWKLYSTTEYANYVWSRVVVDGRYPFLGILDKSVYPDGVRLCYPMNTDARVAI